MSKQETIKRIEEDKELKGRLLEILRIGGDIEDVLKALEAAGIKASIHDVQAFLDKNEVRPLSDDELEAASGGCGSSDDDGEEVPPKPVDFILQR